MKQVFKKIALILIFCTGARFGYAIPGCAITPVVTLCGSSTITLSLSSDPGGTGFTYAWTGSGVDAANTFSVTATPAVGTTVYTVVVTPGAGGNGACAVAGTYSVSVTVNQVPAVPTGTLGLCLNGTTTLTDATGVGTWTTLAENVSVGGGTGIVTGLGTGTADITYTLAGCTSTAQVTVNGLPTGFTASATPNPVCQGTTLTLAASPTGGGATFAWSGPNSFTSTHATQDITNVQPNAAGVYAVVVTNSSGCSSTFSTSAVVVNGITASVDAGPVCTGHSLTLTGSIVGTSNWANTFSWTGPGLLVALSGQNQSIETATTANSGIYTLTADDGAGCTVVAKTLTVTVNEPVTSVSPTSNGPICTGNTLNLSGGVTGGTNVSYAWSGPGGFTSTLLNPSFPIATTDNSGTYIFTATAAGCTGVQNTVDATVNPLPDVSVAGNEGDNTFCNQDIHDDIVLQSDDENATFAWSNNRPSIGIVSAGTTATIPGFTLNNVGFTDSTATISVVATSTVTTCQSSVLTYTITVHPTPSVSNASDTFCNQAAAAVHFSGLTDPAITTFSWSSDNTDVGFGGEGNGDISATATNDGNTDLTTTFTVTPHIGECNGPNGTVTVTAHPTPDVTVTTDRQKCGGDTISLTFTGQTSPLDRYSWTTTNPLLGLPSLGYTTQGDTTFTYVTANVGATTQTAAFTVTDSIGRCAGTPGTFNVTVFPTPKTTNLVNHTYCNGFAVPSLVFTNLVTDATPSYVWFTNNQDIFPIGTRGSYVTEPINNIVGYTATDTFTTATAITRITVVASAHGCNDTTSATITVNPVPVANTVRDTAFNLGQPTGTFTFGGVADSFVWTNDNTSIGAIAAHGIDSISSFTATGNGTANITVTPVIMSTDGQCAGNVVPFVIKVNSFHVEGLYGTIFSDTVCNNTTYSAIAFRGGIAGTQYHWSYSGLNFGSLDTTTNDPTDASDTIASFTVVNAGTDYLTDTFSVYPVGGGDAQHFTITVRPQAAVAITGQTQAKCNGTGTDAISFAPGTAVSGTDVYTFSWVNNDVDKLGTDASGTTSAISSFSVTNGGTSAVVGSISVTPYISGCAGTTVAVSVTVNPTPVLTATSDSVCNNLPIVQPLSSVTDGVESFIWVRDTANFITNIPGSITSESTDSFRINDTAALHNNSDTMRSVLYHVTLMTSAGCTHTDDVVNIVYPTPRLLITNTHFVCNGAPFTDHLESATPGATFAWTMVPVSGISFVNPSGGAVLNNTFTNTTNATQNVLFTTVVTANNCPNAGQIDSIWVRPTARLVSTRDTAICSDVVAFVDTALSSVTDAATKFTWVVVSDPLDTSIYFSSPTSNTDSSGIVKEQSISTRFTHHLDSVSLAYTLFIVDSIPGSFCTSLDTMKLLIKPHAHKPVISAPAGQFSYCNGLLHQNFHAANVNLDNTLNSSWSVSAGNTVDTQQSPFATNCLISFGANISNPVVTDVVWVNGFEECSSAATFDFTDSGFVFDALKTAVEPDVFLYKDEKTLFCDSNTVSGYQWGYDRNDSLTPHVLFDKFHNPEINQDCLFDGVSDENPFNIISVTDATKSFWVKTSQVIGGVAFVQKSYITGTAVHKPVTTASPVMLVYPNPAHADLSFELSGAVNNGLTIEIYDMLGKKIQTVAMENNKATVSVNDLPQGTFMAVCRSNGAVLTTSHFVKN